jgi:hypothetical protein
VFLIKVDSPNRPDAWQCSGHASLCPAARPSEQVCNADGLMGLGMQGIAAFYGTLRRKRSPG